MKGLEITGQGLFDRRDFGVVLEHELERARRSGSPLSLVVCALDRSASKAGRRRVAEAIRAEKRCFDPAARVGLGRFALLAVDCDEHGAYMLAERIRRAVRAGEEGLTASFGIARFPLHGETSEALLGAADQALGAAKRLGTDRSVISSAEVPGILARAREARADARVELGTLVSLAEALDVRATGSRSHCRRVGRFAELTARELGLDPDTVDRLRLAGVLHDLGRVGISEELARKEGPLDDLEWVLVRSHPEIGARMLDTTGFADIGAWVRLHHERPDGRGYPGGSAWEDVPLEARILAVADAYAAMTSDRPHRPAREPGEAAAELRGEAGRQFDPQVVEALLRAV